MLYEYKARRRLGYLRRWTRLVSGFIRTGYGGSTTLDCTVAN